MKNNRLIYLLIIILIIWNVGLTYYHVTQEKVTNENQVINNVVNGFSTDLSEVVTNCKASAVTIVGSSKQESGFIYKSNDNLIYVITSYHGISDSKNVKVIFDSNLELDGKVLGYDIFADLAIIQIESNFQVPAINFGDSDILKAGEFLMCIGTPTNAEFSSSAVLSIVSSPLRSVLNNIEFENQQYEYYTNLVQLDGNTLNGFSGAPVFNMNGDLVCMILMKDDTAVFALPANEIKILAEKIINEQEYLKANLNVKGFFIDSLESYQKNNFNISLDVISGYYILNVHLNGFASNVGLKAGDIILSINGKEIKTYADLLSTEYEDNTEYTFNIIRDNEEITIVGSIND